MGLEKKKITRRQFLKFAPIATAALLADPLFFTRNIHAKTNNENLEKKLLNDFLTWPEGEYLDRRAIENCLYNIKLENFGDKGRAVHIGDGYLLTSYHIVNEDVDKMQLTPSGRFYPLYTFNILDYDESTDLALLKVPNTVRKEKATMHLAPRIPSVGEKVSAFIRLYGTPSDKDYEFEYDGLDFYDHKKIVKGLGKLILPAGSLLFEKEGKIWNYNREILNSDKYLGPGIECFSSIAAFNGESGGPVFIKVGEEKYIFAGIMRFSSSISEEIMYHAIKTPNHPLRYPGMQQVGAFFTHQEPIERLIKKYMERQNRALPQ